MRRCECIATFYGGGSQPKPQLGHATQAQTPLSSTRPAVSRRERSSRPQRRHAAALGGHNARRSRGRSPWRGCSWAVWPPGGRGAAGYSHNPHPSITTAFITVPSTLRSPPPPPRFVCFALAAAPRPRAHDGHESGVQARVWCVVGDNAPRARCATLCALLGYGPMVVVTLSFACEFGFGLI
jgi:hypothetical protein